MQLTSATDFGLRVLMRLAGEPDRSVSTGEIAAEFRISPHHLAKVVQDLGRGGFVRSQRGRNGGLRLAQPATDITLGEVVRHLEQRFAIAECFRADGGDCLLKPTCRLRPQLAAAREAFLSELDRTTIEACAWPGKGPDGSRIAANEPGRKRRARQEAQATPDHFGHGPTRSAEKLDTPPRLRRGAGPVSGPRNTEAIARGGTEKP